MKTILDYDRSKELTILCQKLNIELENLQGLHQALTHTSFANETKSSGISHNERLEFLGDAVLELVVSEYLYRYYPHFSEGELTKARAQIVCEPTLAACATRLGLGDRLLLGKGEEFSGGRKRPSILADVFEAVVGAIYTSSNFNSAKKFILINLEDALLTIGHNNHVHDFKTSLQEYVQRSGETKISYDVVKEYGPDHDKVFEIAVSVNSNIMGTGAGKSKKEAEQCAAKQALIKLQVITDTTV